VCVCVCVCPSLSLPPPLPLPLIQPLPRPLPLSLNIYVYRIQINAIRAYLSRSIPDPVYRGSPACFDDTPLDFIRLYGGFN